MVALHADDPPIAPTITCLSLVAPGEGVIVSLLVGVVIVIVGVGW